jgi:flagellar motor switch protein FliM
MARVLSQEEIDSILTGKPQSSAPKERTRSIVPWNVRETGKLALEQAKNLSMIHDTFARNLTSTMGAYLRVGFDVRLVSVQQLIFDDFLALLPERPYVIAYNLEPHEAIGALQLDLSLVFPIVDLLLGGTGEPQMYDRDISDIEEQIMSEMAQIICVELSACWQPLGASISMGERQTSAQVERLLPHTERALALSFEVGVGTVKGSMNLLFPASLSSALLRNNASQWAVRRRHSSDDAARRVRTRLLNCQFSSELSLSQMKVPARDLLSLAPGSVLRLPVPVNRPCTLLIEKKNVFDALPVRANGRRAAQIGEAVPQENDLRRS